jgi:thymidylate synthase (methanogen type)
MKVVNIGKDRFLGKDIIKLEYESKELPKIQLFNSSDVIAGNPMSNVAVCIVYTWKADKPPEKIASFMNRISNYSALAGFWRTTNGGRYAFANILANPNINKLVVLVFGDDDNGHLLVDSLVNLWKNGIDKDGLVIGSKAPNPKFEQVPLEAIGRLRKQADLVVAKNLSDNFEEVEELVKAMIQESEHAASPNDFEKIGVEFYSNFLAEKKFYDDGARFKKPLIIDLSDSAKNIRFEHKNIVGSVGQSIQARNLADGIEQVASYVYKNGTSQVDERGIITIETRSLTVTVIDSLEKAPKGFSEEYLKKYVKEFMEGKGEKLDEFAYTYHHRIFKKWGNQPEKVVEVLKKHKNTRRALISLWDPLTDLGSSSPPCLDFIWAVVRNDELEFHVVYRSHHLATVTKNGKLMEGEGAFVPNLYALATLQDKMAKELNIKRGVLVLTDFSGHVYVSDV